MHRISVMGTKAHLLYIYLTSERPVQESANEVHLLYPAIYSWGTCVRTDKTASQQRYQVASGHTQTHTHTLSPLAADNKSLLAFLFENPIMIWEQQSVPGDSNYSSHFLRSLSECCCRLFCTAERSASGAAASGANSAQKNQHFTPRLRFILRERHKNQLPEWYKISKQIGRTV